MELKFELKDNETLNNFTLAEVIYRYSVSEINNDVLDPETIARMLIEQSRFDNFRKGLRR